MSVTQKPAPPAVSAWRDKHPLRAWADKEGMDPKKLAKKVAELIRIKRQSVYSLLWGRTLPDIETMYNIEMKTGVTLRAWMDWYRLAPKNAPQKRRISSPQQRRSKTTKPTE